MSVPSGGFWGLVFKQAILALVEQTKAVLANYCPNCRFVSKINVFWPFKPQFLE